jgi:peptide/nickel transport system permease protein
VQVSRPIFALSERTLLSKVTEDKPWFETESHHLANTASPRPSLTIVLSNNTQFAVFVDSIKTVGELLAQLNATAGDPSRFEARISSWSPSMLFDSQFFWHLYQSMTFKGQSYATDQSLLEIIAERGKFSLALTLPMVALSWLLGMIISCFVAYYRDSLIDRLGVFLAVLGMCIPYLAYMLIGQWVMFRIAPSMAAGLSHPSAIFVPVLIAVIAGLGGYVRFYRTIILDQVNQDYVRTARAKGVNLPGVLFKHVLRNSMLPILTNLVSTIPFLIMGSLLLERFFGIPGLGDLMLTSIYSRDVPIITGLTFLTSVLYVFSLLVTDILYAVFDPRVRLQ